MARHIKLKLGRRRLTHKLSEGLCDGRKLKVRRGEEGSECSGYRLWCRFVVVWDIDWHGIWPAGLGVLDWMPWRLGGLEAG